MGLTNTIVAGNSARDTFLAGDEDIFNTNTARKGKQISLGGANIIQYFYGSSSGPAAITNSPLLAALGDYGGLTQTMPPLPGSPAVDGCTNGSTFTNDQRGFPRLLGAFPDIGAVEGIYNPAGPGQLTGLTRLANGTTRFTFTNYTDGSSTVLASTNVALPLNLWTNLGPAVESPIGSGQFQFTDTQATNYLRRFYRVRTP